MLLDPTNNRHMEVYGNRHVLTLKKVKETDFGNYSCMADNSLGRERGSIEVSGKITQLFLNEPTKMEMFWFTHNQKCLNCFLKL